MQKTSSVIIIILLTLFILSCGSRDHQELSGNAGSVTARAIWPGDPLYGQKASIIFKTSPIGVVTVRFIVTASDITTPLQQDFTASLGNGTITGIPAGTNRTLTLRGLNSSNAIIYQGSSSTFTVTAGQTTNCGVITMTPVTPGIVPTSPTSVTAIAGNAQNIISWNTVTTATSYNIYWSTTSGVTKTNGTKISNLTSPYTHSGITNGTAYYYVVTAVNSFGESTESSQASAIPSTIAPSLGYLSFSGNSRVVVPNSTSLNPSQITVEMRVNLNTLVSSGSNQFLIAKGTDGAQGSYYISQNGDQFQFYIGANGVDQVYTQTTPLSLQTNRWYHVAGTYDGSNLKIYVDGVLKGTTAATISPGNTLPLTMGCQDRTGVNYYLNGSLDEVRIWSVARSASEIQSAMSQSLTGSEAGLAAYWRFDEGSGQTTNDSTINGNTGQLGSTSGVDADDPTWVNGLTTLYSDDFESYTVGTFPSSGGWVLASNTGAGSSYQYIDNSFAASGSKSLHLVGSSCWSVDVNKNINLPSTFTYEANVFVDQITSCGCTPVIAIVAANNGTSRLGSVDFNCDGKIYAEQKTAQTSNIYLMQYSAHTWYHVKLVINSSSRTFDVYIDGNLLVSGAQILDSGTPTRVGLSAGHGGSPIAWFDDIKVSQ